MTIKSTHTHGEKERAYTLESSRPRSLMGVVAVLLVGRKGESSLISTTLPGHHVPFFLWTHTRVPALQSTTDKPISLFLSLPLFQGSVSFLGFWDFGVSWPLKRERERESGQRQGVGVGVGVRVRGVCGQWRFIWTLYGRCTTVALSQIFLCA